MSVFLTQAFEQWIAQCAINNLPARPDTLAFARMGREPSRDDTLPPPENITHTVSELKYGHLNSNAIVCSAVIDADVPDFTYDWICLIHQASRTLCGVIKTPERHKVAGETLIRNFVLIYNRIAQAAHITTPPESWQLDINAWLRAGAARATQTLQDFYGHHVFINNCARIFMRDSQACCTQGVVYIAGMRIEIQEATLPALKENDYLYIRAWLDGHTPHGIPITGYQLEHGSAVPDDDSINHFAPIARLTRTTDWEDLRVRTRSFQDALDGITAQLEQATSLAEKATESANSATQAAQNAQNYCNKAEEIANNLTDEVQTKAPLNSPALTGTPTAPTPDISATGGEVATAEFVKQAVSALVNSSPEALDTLNELADALGNDPNFATTMTNALAGKQPLSAILTSLSGLATAENKLPYFSNKNMMALANLSAVGRVMIGQNSKNEVLEYLGVKKYVADALTDALTDEVQTKAPLDSPALTGTPTAPTPDISATGGEVATAEFVKQAVSALVDSSPEALDTLNELAEALGNNPNFATTMTNALAGKQPLSAILTSLSGLATTGNKLPYFSNKNMMALANLSAVGRVMIGQNSKNEVLEYLGVKKYIADALRATTGNAWGSPNVGGLIFAAYCGESDDDNNRTLIRGKVIPGSR
ncbi:phage tail-collar fiber domain-containing protein, partial [Yersinia enterocolitica]|uniref:phage tail-collar fiber domain-containing protein n=1 Tax=Yersinia enterocolitica TaxID=630 RepID=UPI0021558DD5